MTIGLKILFIKQTQIYLMLFVLNIGIAQISFGRLYVFALNRLKRENFLWYDVSYGENLPLQKRNANAQSYIHSHEWEREVNRKSVRISGYVW